MTEKLTRRESFKALLALPVIALMGFSEEEEVDQFGEWRSATSKAVIYHDQVLYKHDQALYKHDQAIGYLMGEHPILEDIDPYEEKTT